MIIAEKTDKIAIEYNERQSTFQQYKNAVNQESEEMRHGCSQSLGGRCEDPHL